MLTKKLLDMAGNMLQKSYTYYAIGKDIYDYSNKTIKHHLNAESTQTPHEPKLKEDTEESLEARRETLRKNMEIPEPDDSFIQSKQESMLASQGVADHSGSSYHGPGKGGDRTNSNMWQRNFENHQGN